VKINRAYKVEIDPNNRQRTSLLRHAGCARWAYNWGLNRKIEDYETTGKSPGAMALHRELNALKKTDVQDGGVPWMYEVSKSAPQEALRDLDLAYSNFFRRCKGNDRRKGFPRFKSRKNGVGSFRLTGTIRATPSGHHVQLPRLGKIRLKERDYLPGPDDIRVKVLSATVSERAGRWFVSLNVEETLPTPKPKANGSVIGVDVGISKLAVLSDGTIIENPRVLKGAGSRLRQLQKSVSRKVKGSSNRRKAVQRLARQHYRVSNIRKDAIHKATTEIVHRAGVVGLETLNVKGMLKNHRLARALSDAAMAEFHRQIEYKALWAGVGVVRADRFYPSSKTCSSCGHVAEDLSLGDRVFRCPLCGLEIDRDLNAALNLKVMAVSSTVTACGEASSGSIPFGGGRN
jgi:putative transposase